MITNSERTTPTPKTITAADAATRPNLFIIGAMKSGTTSLHAYLASHPDIFMSAEKEPEYFAKEEVWSRGEQWYLRLFAEASGAAIVGESSTAYSRLPQFPGVADRIYRFNSEARLIYIMRDPVERSISQYWFRVRFCGERRDMASAIREDSRYIDASHYAMQLQPYLRLFPTNHIAALTFEELSRRPIETVQGLFRWLGVDPAYVPDNISDRENVTPSEIIVPDSVRAEKVARLAIVRQLKPLMPPRFISAINRYSGRFRYIDRRAASRNQAVEYLRPIQTEQTRALIELLGREFPEWQTLYGQASPGKC